MKVVIIGRGQIGTSLANGLSELHPTIWNNDISELTLDEIRVIAPDAIINAAGKTDLKWCEENALETFRSNVSAPVELYQRIRTFSKEASKEIRFLHLSSGCIWDGPYDEAGKPFTPNHPARPAAYYSWTKAACDQLLLAEDPNNLAILRPRQVYSALPSSRNTIGKLLRYDNLIDTPNSMSSLEIIEKTVRHCLTNNTWIGIWNIYDAGIFSPFEVGSLLAEAGLRSTPNKITKSALDAFHKPKRVDTVLYDKRFEELLQPEPIETVLRRTIAQYKLAIEH